MRLERARTAAATAAAAFLYRRFLRQPILTWGATADEAAARLPWRRREGRGPSGRFTYDWIENLLGLNMHSTDRVLPDNEMVRRGSTVRVRQRASGKGPLRAFLLPTTPPVALRIAQDLVSPICPTPANDCAAS